MGKYNLLSPFSLCVYTDSRLIYIHTHTYKAGSSVLETITENDRQTQCKNQCNALYGSPPPTDSRAQGTPQKRGWKEWRSQNTVRSAIRLPFLEIVA